MICDVISLENIDGLDIVYYQIICETSEPAGLISYIDKS